METNEMTNAQMWALIVGALAPLLTSVVQQPHWTRAVRAVVGAVIAVILGLGTAWFGGDFTGKPVVTCVLLVMVAALTTYRNFWRPTGISPLIETATSKAPTTAVPPGDAPS